MSAMVVKVIWTDAAVRGKGVEGDIMRRVYQLWTLEGVLICEYDIGPADAKQRVIVNEGPLAALGQSGGTT